mmetsp:Transcript_13182/g.29964  ORF Transcript_13182/g.29964 Transcript_13182/m.29964 type:complete len:242 (+) Transcript_13182:473-1198(+)
MDILRSTGAMPENLCGRQVWEEVVTILRPTNHMPGKNCRPPLIHHPLLIRRQPGTMRENDSRRTPRVETMETETEPILLPKSQKRRLDEDRRRPRRARRNLAGRKKRAHHRTRRCRKTTRRSRPNRRKVKRKRKNQHTSHRPQNPNHSPKFLHRLIRHPKMRPKSNNRQTSQRKRRRTSLCLTPSRCWGFLAMLLEMKSRKLTGKRSKSLTPTNNSNMVSMSLSTQEAVKVEMPRRKCLSM